MATIIKLNCTNQEITFAENPLVASGGYNEDKLQITFDELWNGYAKICVFYQNPNKHYFAMMEDDDTCVIPYEALQSDGILYLGVFGCNAEGKTRTSQIVKYVVEKGAINTNLEPQEPTPDIYEQLLSKYQLMLETSQKTYQDEQTFESNITQRQNTFEQNITNQVNTFETDITNQQNNFESNMQSQMDNYKVEVPRIAEQYAEQKAQEVVNTKVDKADIVDNLTSTDTDKPLSANQGKELKTLVDRKANSSHTHDDRYYTEAEVDAKVEELNTAIANSGKFYGIDTSNVLGVEVGDTYTATEDCYAFVLMGNNCNTEIDGLQVVSSIGDIAFREFFPLKKGQTIKTTVRITHVFGIKR